MQQNKLQTIRENFPDIQQILELLKEGLLGILGENLVGLYLMGSLTYGDFNRGSSDIDFFVVVKNTLTDNELDELEILHNEIGSEFPEWSKRIEGSYVPIYMLQSKTPSKETRPYVNAGKIWHFPFGDEWLLNLFQIQECGAALMGESIENIIPRVTIEEARIASRNNLLSDWKPKLLEHEPFKSKDYDGSHLQTYAILSLCRVLYTFKVGKVASKKVAADWAKKNYDQYAELIEKAQNWVHGNKIDVQDETLNFIRFVLSVVV